MMYFHKKKGNNAYHVLACMEGFDFDKPLHVQEDKYDAWELTDDFYEMIVDSYNNNDDDELKVKCYTKDADVVVRKKTRSSVIRLGSILSTYHPSVTLSLYIHTTVQANN